MGWVLNATPRPLYPRERPGTHCIGGWVGPRACLDVCGNSRPPPGFDPRTIYIYFIFPYCECITQYDFWPCRRSVYGDTLQVMVLSGVSGHGG